VQYWAAGSLAIGFATVLDGPRLIDDWQMASLLFNIPFSAGQAFILAGTMQFCSRPHAARVLWTLVLLAVVLTVTFTYLVPDTRWRIWTVSTHQAVMNLATAFVLWKYPDPFSRRVFAVGAVIALIQASAAFSQGALVAVSSGAITYAAPQLPIANLISWVGAMFNIVLGNWILFLLIMLRMVADLRIAAERDLLTGLLNRRGLRLHIDVLLRRANNSGSAIGILIMDIDHFKLINDTHGHEMGDRVLKLMGEILLKMNFPNATPCRWGGEEFCIIVDGPTRESLVHIAEQVRAAFQRQTATLEGLGGGRTVSIGIARSVLDQHFEMSSMISIADAQLYLAKLAGRDRVAVAA
jgi:diguanylate cyclase (GGDEF)-like protein